MSARLAWRRQDKIRGQDYHGAGTHVGAWNINSTAPATYASSHAPTS